MGGQWALRGPASAADRSAKSTERHHEQTVALFIDPEGVPDWLSRRWWGQDA
ncbi:hypothetical protein GCM10010221_65730 [Streptomyces parvus]|nr:hypothetical protein GCM10010221_65730 [Streptomyces parvus]